MYMVLLAVIYYMYAASCLQANWALCSLHLLSGYTRLPFPGTMGKDKSWLSWLLTEEINHSAHQRIAFQSASWELHYPAPATHYHADRHWLGWRCGVHSPTSVTARGVSDQSQHWGENRKILRGSGKFSLIPPQYRIVWHKNIAIELVFVDVCITMKIWARIFCVNSTVL